MPCCRESLPKCCFQIFWITHANAVNIASFGDFTKIGAVERSAVGVPIEACLLQKGLPESAVVCHDHEYFCGLFRRGGKVADGHEKCAVAGKRHYVTGR